MKLKYYHVALGVYKTGGKVIFHEDFSIIFYKIIQK